MGERKVTKRATVTLGEHGEVASVDLSGPDPWPDELGRELKWLRENTAATEAQVGQFISDYLLSHGLVHAAGDEGGGDDLLEVLKNLHDGELLTVLSELTDEAERRGLR